MQLEMEKTEQTVLEMLKNNIQIPILLHTEKCMDKAVYQYIENFVYGVVMKGSIEDCAKLKKDTEDTDLMVIWECDVITKQEAMQAFWRINSAMPLHHKKCFWWHLILYKGWGNKNSHIMHVVSVAFVRRRCKIKSPYIAPIVQKQDESIWKIKDEKLRPEKR